MDRRPVNAIPPENKMFPIPFLLLHFQVLLQLPMISGVFARIGHLPMRFHLADKFAL